METVDLPINKNKEITKKLQWSNVRFPYDSSEVMSKAEFELNNTPVGSKGVRADSYVYKAFTLKEFEHGLLLSESFKEENKAFAIELSKQLQKEYDCTTTSQKATAELIAHCYVRILQAQMMITRYINIGTLTEVGVKYMAVLSKELDRANRHYASAIQTLFMLKQPPISVTVKANIANIANNQLIQQNTTIKPI